MDCSELERLLPAFADGEFVDGDRALVEDHLAGCPRCREEVAAQAEFRAFLQAKIGTPRRAPDHLRNRIRHDLAVESTRRQAGRFAGYLGVAAGIALVASGGYIVAGETAATAPEELVAEAVEKHARRLPVEVTPASGDVGGWFRDKVGFHLRVPQFRAEGAPRLVGARLANVREREAAYLVYGDDDPVRRMTLLVYPGDGLALPDGPRRRVNGHDIVLANQKGYNVAMWSQRGVVYSLVSDLDENDVLELVADVEER
jgi:anti-sigma factor RsiW